MLHMEQKSYKYEIINLLLKENIHPREIARKLDTNHMTITRKLKELSDENILDCTQEGRNKIYFLKKTPETKAYLINTENYKLLQTLKKYPELRKIIEEIQKNKKIKLAILFGSYAKKRAKKQSDIDIYIETLSKEIQKEIEEINSKINVKIGKYNKESNLIKEIEKNHIIIRGVEKYYEHTRFFD